MTIDRVILITIDSLGVEAASVTASGEHREMGAPMEPTRYGGLRLPNLGRLGLGHVLPLEGIVRVTKPQGACGRMTRRAASRDSTAGYWELAGLELDQPFGTFPDGFPRQVIEDFERHTGRGVLGNRQAAEPATLDELAAEHMQSGHWIVFTSAESVFELAAHEDVVSTDELDHGCRAAQGLVAPHRVCRVVARPFKGPRGGHCEFTGRRREYPLPPPRPTVLDALQEHRVPVVGVGRISDYFAGRGVVERINSQGNTDAMIKTVEAMARVDHGLFMTHLTHLDNRNKHPQRPEDHFRFLEEFDIQLAMLLSRACDGDLVLLTADHGPVADHPELTHRVERVPILAAGPPKAAGVDLGIRQSFADVGATLAEVFGVEPPEAGESFLKDIS